MPLPTLTELPVTTEGRGFCCRCMHTVGTFPSGARVPYRTEVRTWPGGRTTRFHYCADGEACDEKAAETRGEGRP